MKKRAEWMMRLSFCICILIIIFFTVFYFYIEKDKKNISVYENTGRFTFICPKANEGYWSSAAYGMKKQDQLQNTNTKFIGSNQYSAEEMSAAIHSAVNSEADGIITVGSRSDEIVISALKKATNQQIPVILIDTDSDEIDRLCYIGTNNYEAGQLAAEDMAASTSEPLRVAVILVSLDSKNQAERLRGFEERLSQDPEDRVEIVLETDSNFLYLNEILPLTLKENPDINAVFCAEEYSSTIVGQILSAMGTKYDPIRVVAFDKMDATLHYVESGRYYSTIVQQSEQMGELAVKLLGDYQKGIFPSEDIIYTDSLSIRKENINDVKRYESEGVVWHSYRKNI